MLRRRSTAPLDNDAEDDGNQPVLPRRRSLGNFDQDTASSARRTSLILDDPPRRRSTSNKDDPPMPERYRAPVRSSFDGGGESTAHIHDRLREHPLFKNANKLFVDQLIEGMTVELFQPGGPILEEGDPAYMLYFLHRGEVGVSVKGKAVATLSDGAFFGEMALLEKNSKRNATVKAIGFCDCRVIHKDQFKRLLKLFPAERAFFEAEADRRSAQLQTVKKAESQPAFMRFQQARRKSEDLTKMQELPPPYIAEAFLVTAMLSRARDAQKEAGLDDSPRGAGLC